MSNTINILLIEDNPGDAKLVEIYLRESPSIHFELTHATRLSEGFDYSKKMGKAYDIVLLDLSLPDSSGFETLNKALAGFPSTYSIVVLTGLDDESLGVKAVQLGAQDYLVKGQIDTSSLTRSVLHAIERRRMQLTVEDTAAELKLSELRLLQAQKIAHIGNYELELGSEQMYWSEELYRIYGYPPGQVEPTLYNYFRLIPRKDLTKVKNALQTALETDSPFHVEHSIIAYGDKKLKYIRNQGQISRVKNKNKIKLIGTIQDITDYKRTEEALIQSEQRYRTIFEESQDTIFVITSDGKLVDFNNSFLNLLGYSKEECGIINAYDLFADAKTSRIFREKMVQEGKVKDYEVVFRKSNGGLIDCLITSTIWRTIDGKIRGYHGVIRDVTAIKKTQELIQAKEIAERSNRMKEQFLATMSHEIRTPMNVVVNITHLLESTSVSPKQKEYLDALKQSSDNLLNIINSILDFSKIDSGKLELEPHPFKLSELINDLVQMHKFKAKEKGLNLFQLTDVNLPSMVIGDSHRLHMVLNNLVSNAVKYTEKGEILLRAEVVKDDKEKVSIKFSVRDTGIGIPDVKQKTIFDSFTQARGDISRKYGGTGLGLSIARKLVQLFGDDIVLKSTEGVGSLFTFTIDFDKVNEQGESLSSEHIPVSKVAPLNDVSLYRGDSDVTEMGIPMNGKIQQEIHILLVEDHKLNQIVATGLIKKWSEKVVLDIADNGQIAIDMLEKKMYDVILMDVSMPVMDGYAATLHIRNKMPAPIKDIPIIAMTAHAFNKSAQKCFECGMDEFVSKPIKPETLYAKFNKILAETIEKAKKMKTVNSAQNGALHPLNGHHNGQEKTKVNGIVKKMINLDYLDSLSGGEVDIKIIMLETLVSDLPGEIRKLENDFETQNWEQVKASAHKMKSTCAYMGLSDMAEVAKNIEYNAWERKNLDQLSALIHKIGTTCRKAHKELEIELNNLLVVQKNQ